MEGMTARSLTQIAFEANRRMRKVQWEAFREGGARCAVRSTLRMQAMMLHSFSFLRALVHTAQPLRMHRNGYGQSRADVTVPNLGAS